MTEEDIEDATAEATEEAEEGTLEGSPVEVQGSELGANERLESIVESLLFAADKPLTLKHIAEVLGETDIDRLRRAIESVEVQYQARGVQLHGVAGGYQFRTSPENATWVHKLLAQRPVRLQRAQLETLAIVAYRQPITRPEIDQIRGVDSGGTLKTLMDRSLIRVLGKKEEPGRPILYGTSREFLEFFNLSDLKDLPTLREFHELSEEHQAQVAALESAAPEGSIEEEGEDKLPARISITPGANLDDRAELEEIDQMIRSADAIAPRTVDPGAQFDAEADKTTPGAVKGPEVDHQFDTSDQSSDPEPQP